MADNVIGSSGTSGSSGSSGLYETVDMTVIHPVKKYIIFDTSEIYKINFNEIYETSSETLRKSVDGTKTFIKYDGDMPNTILSLVSKSVEYTYEEIMTILSTEEWTKPIIV